MRRPSPRALAVAAAAVALVLLSPLALLFGIDQGWFDGAVRGGLEAKLHRKVRFGALKAELFARAPRLVFSDLHVGQAPRFGPGELLQARTLDVTLKLWPLLFGQVDAPTIRLVDPVLHLRRLGPGNDNWTFGKGGASSFLGGTRRLEITGGRVEMDDPQRKLTLAGDLSNDPDDRAYPLHVSGRGMLKGADYGLVASAAPLNGRRPDAPWPFRATLQDGATRVVMDGKAVRPFNFDKVDMQMTAQGPNLADLYYLFSFTPLNSRPYVVTARLRASGKDLSATGLRGHLGQSDVEGELTSNPAGARRRLVARLSSQTLTAVDLQTLLASLPPRAVARSQPGVSGKGEKTPKGRIFSQTPFSFTRLQAQDLTLDYSARTLSGFGAPLSDARVRLSVTSTSLSLSPLTFGLAGGRARAGLTLDMRTPRSPAVSLKADLRDVRLGGLTHGAGGVGGVLDASVDARGRGASLAAAAAHASGRAGFRLARGALPKTDAAALGGDLFGMIGAKLGAKGARTGLRCAAADFQIADGVMHARRLLVATDSGLAEGGGVIDLRSETLALQLRPSAQGVKPAVQLSAPITVTGAISKPKVGARLSQGRLSFGGLFGALARPFQARPPPAAVSPDPGC